MPCIPSEEEKMSQKISYKVADNLYLVRQVIASAVSAQPVIVEKPVDTVLLVDCSGSMAWDLPKLREQLKRKLPKLLKESDTISIIWFSGRREFGVLLEAEPVATLKDLKAVEQAIDRWLKPVGLTGFKEPLEEAVRLIGRLKKDERAISLVFMSDGCDNQWSKAELLKVAEQLGPEVHSAAFVEYGYYADRNLLTQLAERCGGSNIFAADFNQYEPTFEAVIKRKISGVPKIDVSVDTETFAFSVEDNELRTYAVDDGSVAVPKDSKEIWYLSESLVGDKGSDLVDLAKATSKDTVVTALYAALALYSQRMDSNVVYSLLRASGDVRFIEQFTNCFGKQRYSDFIEMTTAAAWASEFRLKAGFDPNKVPKEDAFTLLDLLKVLADSDDNKVLLGKPEFKYSRIGRGRIESDLVLTPEEQEEIQKLTEEMAKHAKDAKKVTEISNKIAAISTAKQALKFTELAKEDGYSLQSLTYNEERPNISFLVKKPGTVDLSPRLDPKFDKVPAQFDSFVYRNYTVIKDGLVNLEDLPVSLSPDTLDTLKANGVSLTAKDGYQVLHLKDLPIINRKMVKGVNAHDLFVKAYELAKAKAAQKVYNSYKAERFPKGASEGFVEKYGKEAADWLKEQGITEFSGFSPKGVVAAATDVYMGKELKISLKGLSSLPKLSDVQERLKAKGKLTPSMALMAPTVQEVEDFLASAAYVNSTKKDQLFEAWLDGQTRGTTAKVRAMISDLAKIKFSIVVGQTWPFPTLDENTYTLDVDGNSIVCTIEQKEIEIKI